MKNTIYISFAIASFLLLLSAGVKYALYTSGHAYLLSINTGLITQLRSNSYTDSDQPIWFAKKIEKLADPWLLIEHLLFEKTLAETDKTAISEKEIIIRNARLDVYPSTKSVLLITSGTLVYYDEKDDIIGTTGLNYP